MPNAAKLFGFFGLAAMAFFASEIYKPLLPEGTQMGMLTQINMLIAGLTGWRVMGRLDGAGYVKAGATGLKAAVIALFWILFVWSFWEMLQRSLDLRYDGPVDALQEMVVLAVDYTKLGLTDPQVPIALLVGGMLAAFLAEWATRRWV